jgi:DNA (cytosine-5)-methyltransferase 1
VSAHRPRLLDLFCCQGGASAGYVEAGFDVTGVDIAAQPRYPWAFIQADAVEYALAHGHEYDAIHASPPCQAYTACQRIQGRQHPRLIAAVRAALETSGRPWVIENVMDAEAELRSPVMLCGAAFGLHTYRHRLFEASVPLEVPDHTPHGEISVKMGRPLRDGDWYHAVGNFSNVPYVRRDLGFTWMNRDGLRESIPWQYARHVGEQLLAAVRDEVAA